jgi:hypothetical protein
MHKNTQSEVSHRAVLSANNVSEFYYLHFFSTTSSVGEIVFKENRQLQFLCLAAIPYSESKKNALQ